MPAVSIDSRPIWVTERVPRRRYTVEEYHALQERKAIKEGQRLELLEGWLVERMTHLPRHALAIEVLQDLLTPLLTREWRLRVQLPITTLDSEPEPDLAIVRANRRGRAKSHPIPREVALVVEVADRSLHEDRVTKARLYARAEIPVYWIVNLRENCIEVLTDPTGANALESAYQVRRTYSTRDKVPVLIAGQEIGAVPVRSALEG